MPGKKTIAIFDIGKTNKKFLLFDEAYAAVYESEIRLPETVDEDGFACEDAGMLRAWIMSTLKEHLRNTAVEIVGLNFSAYGASLMHLGEDGKPLTPLYNYLKPFPQDILDPFYERYGGAANFACETASPLLGSLNSGLQIYRIQNSQSSVYRQIHRSVHFPQYLSSLFTGRYVSDMTSIGCHTALWNYAKNDYHDWVYREGIRRLLPEITSSDTTNKVQVGDSQILVAAGLHDSSAALIPYRLQCSEPFVLLSTGTWNICLNPFNADPLSADELEHDCLCYLDFKGEPVKASRLFAGHEHEEMTGRIAAHFGVRTGYHESLSPGLDWSESDLDPGWPPMPFHIDDHSSFENAYRAYMINLVRRQYKSIRYVMPDENIRHIYVDGGFSRNKMFMFLLGKYFPKQEVWRAVISRASAVGAALVIHESWNTQGMPPDLIQLEKS